ncbi:MULTISPECIES: hypothetical protein [Corynebacterium]|uniref:hypothetical protein n=1 Tax=Corynebacterium TaxID=1716 RepID=UPI000AF8C6DC|nr:MULTISPECIES: hypothetical protein [Corynebacterium]
MSDDMSIHIPDSVPNSSADDWVEAHVNSCAGASLTFSAGGKSHVRVFRSQYGALLAFASLSPSFLYSHSRNKARLHDGDDLELPPRHIQHQHCSAAECNVLAPGHKPHHGPVLRAANGPAEKWVPVEVLNVEGMKATLATPRGQVTVYNHQPHHFAKVVEFHEQFGILRCARKSDPASGHTGSTVMWISREPITACTKG